MSVNEWEEFDNERSVQIAVVEFELEGTSLALKTLDQKWESDVIYPIGDSSSSSESSESSPPSESESSPPSESEDSGSSKDSAIVPTPDGYRKWYTMEAADVRFFDFTEIEVARGKSVHDIDPLVVFCIERGTLRAFVSQERGAVTATVREERLEIRARHFPWPRTQRIQIMLHGVRRGFANVRLGHASFDEFVDNEWRLNPRMSREQIVEQLSKHGVTG